MAARSNVQPSWEGEEILEQHTKMVKEKGREVPGGLENKNKGCWIWVRGKKTSQRDGLGKA